MESVVLPPILKVLLDLSTYLDPVGTCYSDIPRIKDLVQIGAKEKAVVDLIRPGLLVRSDV